MKQNLQNLNSGNMEILDAPSPNIKNGYLLINTTQTLISSGTERVLVDFAKSSYLSKARQQPEKVKKALEKIKVDGLMSTVRAMQSKLAEPIALGYCNVGVIAEVGGDVSGFKPGDRVVSNGPHADVVRVAKNLCAKIPDNVDDESAVFAVLGSTALQGIRLAKPALGERFVVIGAGLIGLLAIQILRAHGCMVLAMDLDENKLAIAKQFGADVVNSSTHSDPVAAGLVFSRGYGVDGVIITASTKSNVPVMHAARMSRKRGRIILVGLTGLELNRADFYEKELTFQVSCSYGPGRYDPDYEQKGNDYPIGFVRWTEQRNFQAVLDLIANGQLKVKPLITHRFNFEESDRAYNVLLKDNTALGILLTYPSDFSERHTKEVPLTIKRFLPDKLVVGFIGAGNYASRILIPAFKKTGVQLHTIVTTGGLGSVIHGKKAGFISASTDIEALFDSPEINTLVIVTRHDTHAQFIIRALSAGKHIFVEKPLAINRDELAAIEIAYRRSQVAGKHIRVMVGFNRRFSPHAQKMKVLLQTIQEPKAFIYTVNAGVIPAGHWILDKKVSGGRIIGECCHFIDLMRFLVGSEITSVKVSHLGNSHTVETSEDNVAITLGFSEGSFGTIHYLVNGAANFPKERIEVFAGGRILQLDNFRSLRGFGWPNFKKLNLLQQDKGQFHCAAQFVKFLECGEDAPIPFQELVEVARVSIEAAEQFRIN